jgi:predicted dehydrogenase
MKTISVGLVGLGSFGSAFADLFKAHPLVGRIALCDQEPERVEAFASKESWRDKFHERDRYDSLDAILKSDLEALVLITQHWLHAPQAVRALEAGKHVYSAVPLVWLPDGNEVLDWAGRLVETVRQTGLRYMLGETTFYHPEAMYCRRQARAGAFGDFVYSEGEYFHAFDSPGCDLRQVQRSRADSPAGRQWRKTIQDYIGRGLLGGPMHYPTHSVSGPMGVMDAHAVRVACWGQKPFTSDPYFRQDAHAFGNETALFLMSNGSTMRICEHRECSVGGETFRIYGTKGSFEEGVFKTLRQKVQPARDQMRDPLPPEVVEAFEKALPGKDFYGGHGGSHAYLVHEFVDAVAKDRMPAISAWEAARYTAAGTTAHQSALRDGEVLAVPDFGDAPR